MVLGLRSGQTSRAASRTASTASEIVRAFRRRCLLRSAASASESTRQSESKLELRIGVFLLLAAALGRGGSGPFAADSLAAARRCRSRDLDRDRHRRLKLVPGGKRPSFGLLRRTDWLGGPGVIGAHGRI